MHLQLTTLVSMLIFPFTIGCTTIHSADLERGKTKYHFGVVKISVPKSDPRINAVKLQTFGMAFHDGLTIGWRDSEQVLVPILESEDASHPPKATCSVVIIVRKSTDAQHAKQLLDGFGGEDVCVTAF